MADPFSDEEKSLTLNTDILNKSIQDKQQKLYGDDHGLSIGQTIAKSVAEALPMVLGYAIGGNAGGAAGGKVGIATGADYETDIQKDNARKDLMLKAEIDSLNDSKKRVENNLDKISFENVKQQNEAIQRAPGGSEYNWEQNKQGMEEERQKRVQAAKPGNAPISSAGSSLIESVTGVPGVTDPNQAKVYISAANTKREGTTENRLLTKQKASFNRFAIGNYVPKDQSAMDEDTQKAALPIVEYAPDLIKSIQNISTALKDKTLSEEEKNSTIRFWGTIGQQTINKLTGAGAQYTAMEAERYLPGILPAMMNSPESLYTILNQQMVRGVNPIAQIDKAIQELPGVYEGRLDRLGYRKLQPSESPNQIYDQVTGSGVPTMSLEDRIAKAIDAKNKSRGQ